MKNSDHNGNGFALTAPPELKKRGPGRPPLEGESIQAARRRKEIALADLRDLEVRRRREELLEAAVVERTWVELVRTARAALLAVPGRIRARLPHLSPQDAEVVDQELRAALTALGGNDGDR